MGVDRVGGVDLSESLKTQARSLKMARANVLRVLAEEWREIVRTTTWFSPRPSPDALIIARLRGDNTLDFGWIHYPSGAEGGQRRLEMRLKIFFTENLRQDRMQAMLGRVKVGE